jgi:hypothetical protein
MRERRSDKTAPTPWRVPVALEDVAETGQHFGLVADEKVRAAVGRMAGLRDLPRLEANFDVTRYGAGGLRISGRVSATVAQNCVVTLEPLASEVEEEIDLVFAPRPAEPEAGESETAEGTLEKSSSDKPWNRPEPLVGGAVDLGALATEFLILGIDPYPRKPGAIFEPPQDVKPEEGPFAVLAQLTKGRHGR